MTLNTGNLTYEILARGHHHGGGGTYSGTGDGTMEWWMWVILAIGVIAILWSVVKKFTN
ncbi:hypothetical protein [Streptomyces sp. NPDC053427]|uniref:hypothetical protein n=1 Tax=Streptomyces sp. NPDC053427 TaxID=3365701 RepID=UPI0037D09D60